MKPNTDMDSILITGSPKFVGESSDTHFRGSIFRGVSRNGRSWQVLVMVESEKLYLCTTENPHLAALIYDLVTIQSKGL